MTRRRGLLGSVLSLLLAACDAPTERGPSELYPLTFEAISGLYCGALPEAAGECGRDADCAERERCVLGDPLVEDRAALALRCAAPIGIATARSSCGQGSECESGLCALTGVCLSPCRGDADCQRGHACLPVEVRTGEDSSSPVAACARVAAFSDDVRVRVGPPIALASGRLNRVPVDVEGQDALLFVQARCGRTLRLQRLVEARSERVLFDVAAALDGVIQPNPVINTGALLPILLPDNPRLSLVPSYDLGLTIDTSDEVHVLRALGSGTRRKLDLNVFYVGGGESLVKGGLRPGDGHFQDVLMRLAQRYEQAGIALTTIREVDVIGALRDQLAVLTAQAVTDGAGHVIDREVQGLDRLFQLSAGLEDGGLNVFVVREMGPVLGISGALPGSLGLHGTGLSGVAIALDIVGIERADRVLFHELGHQMGLFHTSESDGFSFEPLSDTPVCSAERDADGNGVLSGVECDGFGADNLMFWEGLGDALSPQQIALLQRSLVLR